MELPFDQSNRSAALPQSLWAATAEPAPETQPLLEDQQVDVAIIGAGFTGLSAALHLAEHGTSVACLDATEIGWGASGRNNGQVIPGLKHDPDKVMSMLGQKAADPLIKFSGDAPSLVFSLIKKHQIQCDAVQKGWIQPAPSPSSVKEIESRVKQWKKYNAPVDMIDSNQLEKRLGTSWYQSAWIDHRGGSLNPLSYARGLANAAIKAGASVYTKSPVLRTQKVGSKWHIITSSGAVQASKLLICTNAYTGNLDAKVSHSIIPVRTAQLASAPLSSDQWKAILPNGEAASDASKLLTSFRITSDKRLIMGGAYATGGDENTEMFARLKSSAQNRFPHLSRINWDFNWSGYLAITPPHLPQIFDLGGGCYSPIGCNGRGIAMTTATGKALAEHLLDESKKECIIPIVTPKPFFFHAFRHIGIATNVAICSLQDKLKR
ncbi:NAD(P)/FAD-dependent oxidoreductase [Marinomonas sp. 2405UD68-3]|uniref:NAD(P)/FAD-dependent oxidoreductase n=1 Tax=Marinomonas sp. 2405UD68-3 TaxID=3391835 RepID=UPI0039C9E31E